ncbi:MAG TPA: hypothetical protein VH482_07230 [Thermomicrobiales bacterium]
MSAGHGEPRGERGGAGGVPGRGRGAHYLNAARVEQEAYDNVVTDWERERYLERG